MPDSELVAPKHDRIEANLSPADDRVLLNNWLPPQAGVVPRIRIGQRWINVLWALPVGFVMLVISVAVAQALRELRRCRIFWCDIPAARRPRGRSMTASRRGCASSIS
jgi:hypothetical protein